MVIRLGGERKLEIEVGVKPNKFGPSLSTIKLVRSGAIAKVILQPSQTDRCGG